MLIAEQGHRLSSSKKNFLTIGVMYLSEHVKWLP